MRYHNITKDDMLNGDGLRVVLWVSGCSHKCEGCQNPVTWDKNCGLNFETEAKNEIYKELNKEYNSGLTLSGGDPLFPDNRAEILALVKEVKNKYPDKTIWLYTGFEWDYLIETPETREILDFIDVIVDGRFILKERDVTLLWKGSKNQRVIDVKKSLASKEVVLYAPDYYKEA